MSQLDQYYRRLILGTVFYQGWGSFKELVKVVRSRRKYVASREACLNLVDENHPIEIEKETSTNDCTILHGGFKSPFLDVIPNMVPEEVKRAKFEFIMPKQFKSDRKPVVIHFAGTGDQHFWRRRTIIAKPLLNEYSISSILIENPFYGYRRPKDQNGTNLKHVKDLFIMGSCLITECLAIMRWCERMGFGPFVLTGVSMGGHMASASSTVWPKALALVPCLSWTSAASVFTRGVMSGAIPWKQLIQQYYSDTRYRDLREELLQINKTPNKGPALGSYLFDSNVKYEQLANYNSQMRHQELEDPVNREVVEFMHLLMEDCTHLINYDTPFDTNLISILTASDDAYVLRDGVNDFNSIWPGSQVEYLDRGHVSAFLFAQKKYRETIMKALQKLIEKYHSN